MTDPAFDTLGAARKLMTVMGVLLNRGAIL